MNTEEKKCKCVGLKRKDHKRSPNFDLLIYGGSGDASGAVTKTKTLLLLLFPSLLTGVHYGCVLPPDLDRRAT